MPKTPHNQRWAVGLAAPPPPPPSTCRRKLLPLSPRPQESLAQLKTDGNSHFAKKEYAAALSAYDKALGLVPADAADAALLHSNKAACHMMQKQCVAGGGLFVWCGVPNIAGAGVQGRQQATPTPTCLVRVGRSPVRHRALDRGRAWSACGKVHSLAALIGPARRYKEAVTECSAALEGQPNFFKALVRPGLLGAGWRVGRAGSRCCFCRAAAAGRSCHPHLELVPSKPRSCSQPLIAAADTSNRTWFLLFCALPAGAPR